MKTQPAIISAKMVLHSVATLFSTSPASQIFNCKQEWLFTLS